MSICGSGPEPRKLYKKKKKQQKIKQEKKKKKRKGKKKKKKGRKKKSKLSKRFKNHVRKSYTIGACQNGRKYSSYKSFVLTSPV